MRLLVTVTAVGLLAAVPAGAVADRLDWPLRPRPAVVRAFDAPASLLYRLLPGLIRRRRRELFRRYLRAISPLYTTPA